MIEFLNLFIKGEYMGNVSETFNYKYNQNTNLASQYNTIYIPKNYELNMKLLKKAFPTKLQTVFFDKKILEKFIKDKEAILTKGTTPNQLRNITNNNAKLIIKDILFKEGSIYYIKGNQFYISAPVTDISCNFKSGKVDIKKLSDEALINKFKDIVEKYDYIKNLPNYQANSQYYKSFVDKQITEEYKKFMDNNNKKELYIKNYIAKYRKSLNVNCQIKLYLSIHKKTGLLKKLSCRTLKNQINQEWIDLCKTRKKKDDLWKEICKDLKKIVSKQILKASKIKPKNYTSKTKLKLK